MDAPKGHEAAGRGAGYVAAVAQAVLYATMGIFAKLLYGYGLNAQHVMLLRFACTVVFLGLFILFFHERKFISRQPAVYVQSIFFFLSAWTYFLGVERISAGIATVLFYTYPAVVAIINVVAFHERLSARTLAALILSMGGVVLISGLLSPEQETIDPLGMSLTVGSSVAFAIYSVLIQKTARVESSFTATFTLSLIALAASLLLFAGDVGGLAGIGIEEIALASALSILATIAPIVLYIYAVGKIGATKAAIISIVETPSSLILAWLVLSESIDGLQAIGAALVMIAIAFVTLKPRSKGKGTE